MNKLSTISLILFIALIGFNCQTKSNNGLSSSSNLKSLRLAGIYRFGSYGDTTQTGPGGQVIVYVLSNDSALFYLDVSRGAPSYNMGTLYDRFCVNSDSSIYYKKFDYFDGICKWKYVFSDSTLTITTIDNGYDCGFGANVWADGVYKKVDTNQPEYFVDLHGVKYYFAKTKPEDYDKILK
jgi:hypothetical protein